MDTSVFLHLSPLFIVFLSTIVLGGMILLYRWRRARALLSLSLIPILFSLAYSWVFFFEPEFTVIAPVVRSVVIMSLSCAMHVIYFEIRATLSRVRHD